MRTPALVERIINAHGGCKRWQSATEVMARVSMGGAEFASRLQPHPLRDVEVTAATASPALTINDFPRAGLVARYQPNRVWITSADGAVLEERTAPGASFRSTRHLFWWDDLDMVYYCGLLLWQALCLPLPLLRSGCVLEELPPMEFAGERMYPLRVVLPADIPSVAPEQLFYADATGLIRRIDYTPRLYGSWVKVAQLLEQRETVDGYVHATRRRMYLCSAGGFLVRAMPMAWLYLDDISVARNSASS